MLKKAQIHFGRMKTVASTAGQVDVIEWLLSIGVPWNALDKNGFCAGDYAMSQGHVAATNLLIDAGCRAEMVLGAIERRSNSISSAERDFLEQSVTFTDDSIIDSNGEAVMMRWEAAIMEAHAEALCVRRGHVLNIGFGLGLIDEAIQRRQPVSHTIIEAHPQIYQKMIDDGWNNRPSVTLIHARWQDAVDALSGFDSVFFDTYGEHYSDLQEFHQHLQHLLKPDGVYSFFNGLAPDNAFFHLVYCEIIRLELASMGLTTQFVRLPIDVSNKEIWGNVRNRYWHSDGYNLPVAQLEVKSDASVEH